MRNLYDREVARFRLKTERIVKLFGSVGDDESGCFEIPSPHDGEKLFVIATTGGGWDCVRVSCRKRCPNWSEMSYVKSLFFASDDIVYQVHVGEEDRIRFHNNALLMWRCLDEDPPVPPAGLIAPVEKALRKEFYEKYPSPGPAET